MVGNTLRAIALGSFRKHPALPHVIQGREHFVVVAHLFKCAALCEDRHGIVAMERLLVTRDHSEVADVADEWIDFFEDDGSG